MMTQEDCFIAGILHSAVLLDTDYSEKLYHVRSVGTIFSTDKEIREGYPKERPRVVIADIKTGEHKTVGAAQLTVVYPELFEMQKQHVESIK